MDSIAGLARTTCGLIRRPAGQVDGPATQALVVLVLFVIWLLATGHGLVPAVAAATVIAWVAERASSTGVRR